MVRITVEMIPHGMEKHKKTIATCVIVNDGTGTKTNGNYNVYFNGAVNKSHVPIRVVDFNRTRKSIWGLLHRALDMKINHGGGDPIRTSTGSG